MRFHELSERMIDAVEYDLQGKFDHYNRVCFDGELPKMPLRFASLKGLGGHCTCRFVVDPKMAKAPKSMRTIGANIIPGSISITLDKKYMRDEQQFDALLIHEMVHAWFFHHNDLRENHGLKFLAKCKECEAKVGFAIPRTEKMDNPVLSDNITLQRFVVLFQIQKMGSPLYAFVNAQSFANMNNPTLKGQFSLRAGSGAKLYAFEVQSKFFTQAALASPVQRPKALYGAGGKGGVKWFYKRNRADFDLLFKEAQETGKKLVELEQQTTF
jgi:hypothetical protein